MRAKSVDPTLGCPTSAGFWPAWVSVITRSQLKRRIVLGFFLLLTASVVLAQVSSPDSRYKADILLVVAHPDDDTVVASYLARAVFDQHKRVAVVFCTPGDS